MRTENMDATYTIALAGKTNVLIEAIHCKGCLRFGTRACYASRLATLFVRSYGANTANSGDLIAI